LHQSAASVIINPGLILTWLDTHPDTTHLNAKWKD
jgi:hypothetical protein